jgi:hypothetical protein
MSRLRFQATWRPVRAKKTRQINNRDPVAMQCKCMRGIACAHLLMTVIRQ